MASSSPITLPFLRFPVEVRLCVYRFLIPNVTIRNFPLIRGRNKTASLRIDNVPCCPALLRTNHQIYNELVSEWYGSTPYEVILDNKYVLFCGKVIPPYASLPSTIQWVRSIQLSFSIQGAPRFIHSPSTLESLLGFQDRVMALALSLSPSGTRQLRNLHITVVVNIPLLMSLSKTPSELLDLLSWNFGPLREMVSDVPQVEWELFEQSYGIQSWEFIQSYAGLKAVMQGYLEDMRSDMIDHPEVEDGIVN
ncbi:hypothetical protein EYZ11_007814 [Aspergillus tanneri]|uniref:F-box domain-containing protein n=1 Tax=Aspergillus tanneri TaxID=1220188 RepID=A0A4S3JE92_9EURO|nr:uncharacterized protein ATNIH1004_000110 [Aspergillus tanneri]KAA8651232.1 hypothetical protein ATNIH1004_000110 [Aspergillus tanneri]THC92707.1 hypothetical protein EYZ11_007814 [Aspergillus tanneri]